MSELGLRDRKRIDTRRRIAESARTLALASDIEHTTIEAIAARADISPRTFFNYFESKEDAVLGLDELDLSAEAIAAHVQAVRGKPTIDAVVALIFAVYGDTFGDPERHRAQKEIVLRFPQLITRHVARITDMSGAMSKAVATLLDHDGRAHGASAAQAELLLSICIAAVRAIGRENTPGIDGDPVAFQRAVATLVRDTMARLRDA